jgi:hypothetical protein
MTFPHGHVLASLGTLKNVGLDAILTARPSRDQMQFRGCSVLVPDRDPRNGAHRGTAFRAVSAHSQVVGRRRILGPRKCRTQTHSPRRAAGP